MKKRTTITHTAIHEAGHTTVHLLNGGTFDFVEIATVPHTGLDPWGEVKDFTLLGRLVPGDRVYDEDEYCNWQWALLGWGGIIACQIHSRTGYLYELLCGGENDYAMIRQLLQHPDEKWTNALIDGSYKQCRKLLRKNWELVLVIARELDKRKRLTFNEVVEIVEKQRLGAL